MQRWEQLSCLALLVLSNAFGAEEAPSRVAEITVDAAVTTGKIRPLNSVNGGVLSMGGMVDTSEFFRDASFPYTRLHDCQWPEPAVVDISTLFRDFRADPKDASNFYFDRTDDYLEAIHKTGTKIFFRLGQSIEHSKRKYDVHPPADYEKWAQICVGIIRHYNEGWANGFHYGIEYWEIWNEPEVRPQMWSGTDADYYRLYATTARAIKREFPRLKVGGPGSASPGSLKEQHFQPTPFLAGFFEHCKKESVPLDFFSWHTYSSDPTVPARLAKGVRQMLDELGFKQTESHLDEWNYLPDDNWDVFSRGTPSQREQWYANMTGAPGAAFTACVLANLQDAPLDMAYYYTAEPQGFGLFSQYGEPHKAFYTLKAFHRMLETPHRLTVVNTGGSGLSAIAGADDARSRINILVSNFRGPNTHFQVHMKNLPWEGATQFSQIRINETANWQETHGSVKGTRNIDLPLELSAAEVLLVQLSR